MSDSIWPIKVVKTKPIGLKIWVPDCDFQVEILLKFNMIGSNTADSNSENETNITGYCCYSFCFRVPDFEFKVEI